MHVLPTHGLPPARYGHTCVAINGVLYMFGGKLTGGNETNELWAMEKHVWRLLPRRGNVPSARSFHAAVAVGPWMLVFGGVCEGVANNQLYLFNSGTSRWSWEAVACMHRCMRLYRCASVPISCVCRCVDVCVLALV